MPAHERSAGIVIPIVVSEVKDPGQVAGAQQSMKTERKPGNQPHACADRRIRPATLWRGRGFERRSHSSEDSWTSFSPQATASRTFLDSPPTSRSIVATFLWARP